MCVCLAVPACDQADNSDCDRALTLAPFVIQLRALCERSSTHSAFKLLQSAFPAPSILVASCETREPIEVCNSSGLHHCTLRGDSPCDGLQVEASRKVENLKVALHCTLQGKALVNLFQNRGRITGYEVWPALQAPSLLSWFSLFACDLR